jgi:UDP-N-acetylglucosamine diphosphorylase / glucose-1-phosphate thymidylyltransferase / UDP-N-acetylgalactosamine diphosphorylase / glucosamine-1-phosphate N-acetyltransferase / galactosamine-1-phosphate N-acetyltransferase
MLFTRMGLVDVMSERSGLAVNSAGSADLYVSGTVLLSPTLAHEIRDHRDEDRLFCRGDVLLAATVVSERLREKVDHWLKAALLREELSSSAHGHPDPSEFGVPVTEVSATMLRFPWDIVEHNGAAITADAEFFMLGTVDPLARVAASAELLQPGNIFIGAEAYIGPGVVLDASEGPIVIDRAAELMPQAVVMGPAYIGPNARVKVAAKIYGSTTVGPWCKVGGEVEGSIFHSYASKQHDGFVGHSYFAPWTNIGADSNTSDLKNNYSSIRVTLEGRTHDTGRMFLGTIMADHAKSGINTMFNTGTTVGVGCNIYGGDFPPKFLPSFSWGGAGGVEEYDFDRFCDTAAIVMRRRDRTLTEAERRLLRDVYAATSSQRRFAS